MAFIFNKTLLLSVIIPVYNDVAGLRETVSTLVLQTLDAQSYEIIIADNNSHDGTHQCAKEFQTRYPGLIKVVNETGSQSSYAARNKGLRISRGQFITFADADMTVPQDFLENTLNLMASKSLVYMAANVSITTKHNRLIEYYNRLTGFPVESYVTFRHFAPTCCLTVKRDIFNICGFFDPTMISGGDREFGNRVFDKGFDLYYSKHLVMYHPARRSFLSLMKKNFRIGRGHCQLYSFFPQRYSEFNRNIFAPKYYAPYLPSNYVRKLKKHPEYGKTPFTLTIALYILASLEKFTNHLGYIYETLVQRHSTRL